MSLQGDRFVKLDHTIQEYALKNYRKMLREPEGNLKYKFLVPGSVYAQELWDWDSWLANIAIRQFAQEDIREYERGCILNFLEYIDEQGRIPVVIKPNTMGPDYTKMVANIHKPCLVQHAAFIVQQQKEVEWLREHFQKMLRFVNYYIENCKHSCGLYYWINDMAIGVDNDPCTFYRPQNSSASIYLNCLMYKELEAVCYIGEQLKIDVVKYELEKEQLKIAVQELCYDERDGFFYSADLNLMPVDLSKGVHVGAPRTWECLIQRIGVWSGLMALWSGIATPKQADKVVSRLLADDSLWARYGIRSLANYEQMYAIEATHNPSCWLGPIWGIANYMTFRGLVKYGYNEAATELTIKTITLYSDDIKACGEMHEYYHPDTGQPIMRQGFQNWNLLAINMQAWLEGGDVVEEF